MQRIANAFTPSGRVKSPLGFQGSDEAAMTTVTPAASMPGLDSMNVNAAPGGTPVPRMPVDDQIDAGTFLGWNELSVPSARKQIPIRISSV